MDEFVQARVWLDAVRAAVGSRVGEGFPDGPIPCDVCPITVCGIEGLAGALGRDGEETPALSVVSLCEEHPPLPPGTDHFRLPLQAPADLMRLPPSTLESFFRAVDYGLSSGKAVYIHCQLGAARSVCAAAAFLMWRGHGLRDALVSIARTRPHLAITEMDIFFLSRLQKRFEDSTAGSTVVP